MRYCTLQELAHSDGYYTAVEPITGDELKHWKYIDKYKSSSGKWIYVYANKDKHRQISYAQEQASQARSSALKWDNVMNKNVRDAKNAQQRIAAYNNYKRTGTPYGFPYKTENNMWKQYSDNPTLVPLDNGDMRVEYPSHNTYAEDKMIKLFGDNEAQKALNYKNQSVRDAEKYEKQYNDLLDDNGSKVLSTVLSAASSASEKAHSVYQSAKKKTISAINSTGDWISGLFKKKEK